jgi:ATP phosphoribosyltransferase
MNPMRGTVNRQAGHNTEPLREANMKRRRIKLDVPDGHHQEQATRLLGLAGLLAGTRAADDRCYSLSASRGWLAVQFARPAEIASTVCRGEADVGICGLDWIEEAGGGCVRLLDLVFGQVDLRLLVPKRWRNVTCAADLLTRVGSDGLMVWTEYPLITRGFFAELPAHQELTSHPPSLQLLPWHEEATDSPVTIRLSFGKTEAKEVLVDVVDTGRTAESNGKKSIATVLAGSTAWLIASHEAMSVPWKAVRIAEMAEALRVAREDADQPGSGR